MNYKPWVSTLILLLCLVAGASASTLVTATNPADATSLTYVSDYDLSPVVFYPYETGTSTVNVTNGANASVSLSQPNLIDPHAHVMNRPGISTGRRVLRSWIS